MELIRTAACNDIDLTAAAPSGFGRIERTQDLEFADRVNARVCLDRQIRSAVSNIRTVNRKGILTAAGAVDRDLDRIRLPIGIRRTDVHLIGKI